jgi:hypothetical protein
MKKLRTMDVFYALTWVRTYDDVTEFGHRAGVIALPRHLTAFDGYDRVLADAGMPGDAAVVSYHVELNGT